MDEFSGDRRFQFINSMAEQGNYSREEKLQLTKSIPENVVGYFIYFKLGYLALITDKKLSEESILIARRFVDVFDFAYTRFLDIQKAEAQAREAQIETALERVRAVSMAMHKSDELVQVVKLLDKEIAGLGIVLDTSNIITDFSDSEKGLNICFARQGQNSLEKYHVPYLNHSVTTKFYQAINNGVNYYSDKYSKSQKDKYFRLSFQYSEFRKFPKESQEFLLNTPGWTRAIVISKNSVLIFMRFYLTEFTVEEEEIFKRFGKVFEQSYTRFLDLQKAEAQAREAEIELALERVRAKAMAMHNSEDLAQTVDVFFKELKNLDVTPRRCGVTLINEETHIADLTVTTAKGENTDLKMTGKLTLTGHPVLEDVYNYWKRQKNFILF